jgi:hypothetical protein
MGFEDLFICSMAAEIIESPFKILSQGFKHLYIKDTWTRNTHPYLGAIHRKNKKFWEQLIY